jgi:outer membrane protein assembly factor BamB
MSKKYEFLSSFILLIVLGMFVSSCGDSGGSSINSTSSQTLDTWTDESTDATVPVTDLRMVKISTAATDSDAPLISTIAVVNGTITALTDIKVWWNTVDDFTTATQVGIKTSPDVGGAYKISLAGAGNGSGFLYYTISIPNGTTGNYYMRVLSIEGASTDSIPLPKPTDTRNVLIPPVIVGEGELKWKFETGGAVVSSPAIGNDGTIYVSSDDHFLYALNPDGSLKWKYETGDKITASPSIGSDGTIYVGSHDRQLYAINPSDGTLKWVFPTKSVFTSSPAIGSDGTIYVGGTDLDRYIFKCPSTCDYSPVPEDCIPAWSFEARLSTLYAIKPDGTLKWSIKLNGTMGDAAENYFPASSPAIGSDGMIYVGTDGDILLDRLDSCNKLSEIPASNADPNYPVNGHLYAINPNGTKKWDFRTLGGVDSSPAIGSDGTIYVGSDGIHLGYGTDRTGVISLNPQTQGFVYAIYPYGNLKWLFDALGDVDCSPALGTDGTIYVGSDNNHVYALNPADGKIKTIVNPDGSIIRQWIFPTRGNVNSSPALGSDGTIYVGSNSKFDDDLYAINPDGTEKWRFDTENFVNSSPTIGPDGTIYVGSNDGYLYAIKGKGTLAVSPWPKFHHDLRNTGRK